MLDRKGSLLIITDVQGKLANIMFEREVLFKNIGIIIEGFKILDIPILWLEQYPEGLGSTVPTVVSHLDGYKPMSKKTFSALNDQNILNRFNEIGRDQILITGIETHICIYQTSMQLISMGIETHVVQDAVSSRTEYNKKIGLEKIARAGGYITSVETALFELLGIAEGEAFKKILELVK